MCEREKLYQVWCHNNYADLNTIMMLGTLMQAFNNTSVIINSCIHRCSFTIIIIYTDRIERESGGGGDYAKYRPVMLMLQTLKLLSVVIDSKKGVVSTISKSPQNVTPLLQLSPKNPASQKHCLLGREIPMRSTHSP